MINILIVEDDVKIGDMLNEVLVKEGYGVFRAYSGTEALLFMRSNSCELVLLDLMLPGLTGDEVLSHISGIPVIVMSAKADLDSKVNLLTQGAADYITKPFEIKELLARISVALRKNSATADVIGTEDISVCVSSHSVKVKGKEVLLTKTEFAILKLLVQNSGQVLAKSVILDRISIDTPDCTERSLKQHISNLRKKLCDAGQKDYIEAVWGIGFKLT